MSRLDKVMQARSILQSMRSAASDADTLSRCIGGMEVVPPDLMNQLTQLTQNAELLRKAYTDAAAAALAAADILPRTERQVIVLYYVAGKTMGQVAEEMHYSERAIRRKKASAIDKLREGSL